AGATFKVIFEEFQREGQTVEYGEILAAEIVNRGKTFCLFSIPEEEQQSEHQASERQFLRYPLQFTRISSVFTAGRFHPVLKRTRPHLGVDFAAPAGTPVRAIAGGTVTYAGRNLGYGIYVHIDHPGPYDSAYAHLKRIARGVKAGATVERGQLIGYVGSTGWATGPHLHFELHKNGKYVNPLTAKLPLEEAVAKKKQIRVVTGVRKRLAEQLATVKIGDPSVVTFAAAAPTVTATVQDASGTKPRQPS
ncbi:MAG: M23 family metallopeptidase, partial [Candidatus Binatia bacterium]